MAGSVARTIAKTHGGKTSEALRVPISALYFNPKYDHRTTGITLEDISWIMDTIREDGWWTKEPIEVRPHKETSLLEIVDGRRRYRAAKAVVESGNLGNWDGLVDIVPEYNMSDEELLFKTIKSNNENRKPFTMLEEGTYFKQLIEEFNVDREVIAKKIGKSLTYIVDRLALVNLNPEMKNEMASFIETGILSPTAAVNIAKLPVKDQAKIWTDVKARHNEQKVVENNNSETLVKNGQKPTKKVPAKIKVKDIVQATKGTSDHISIKILKANLEIAKKMKETNSDTWDLAYELLKATSENRIYA